eukprot:2633157-Rhodomonas_salina.2
MLPHADAVPPDALYPARLESVGLPQPVPEVESMGAPVSQGETLAFQPHWGPHCSKHADPVHISPGQLRHLTAGSPSETRF